VSTSIFRAVTAAALLAACFAHAQDPLVVREGDEIEIKGRVREGTTSAVVGGLVTDVKVLRFHPSVFVATDSAAKTSRHFTILDGNSPVALKAVELSSWTEVLATCRFAVSRKPSGSQDFVCDLKSAKRYVPEKVAAKNPEPPDLGRVAFQPIHREWLLESQLRACQQLGAAGDPGAANRCSIRTKNAFDVIKARSETSHLPLSVWGYCAQFWMDDMTLGARCITAAEDICKTSSPGVLQDQMECLKVMGSGAWVANPKARSLTFDAPGK
jgi:hypothetical protein